MADQTLLVARRRHVTAAIAFAAIVCSARNGDAQTLSIPSGNSEAAIIASAEAEATSFPSRPGPTTPGRNFVAVQNGTADRRCVEGTEVGPIRSGEFVIGGQLGGSRAMRAGNGGKIWWAPLHHSLDMDPLLVRGR